MIVPNFIRCLPHEIHTSEVKLTSDVIQLLRLVWVTALAALHVWGQSDYLRLLWENENEQLPADWVEIICYNRLECKFLHCVRTYNKKKTIKENLKKAKTHLVTNECRVKGSQNIKMTLITWVKTAGVMLVEIKEHLWECLPKFHRSSNFCSGIFWQMHVAHHLILNYTNSIQQQWQLCGALPQWNSTATKVSAD